MSDVCLFSSCFVRAFSTFNRAIEIFRCPRQSVHCASQTKEKEARAVTFLYGEYWTFVLVSQKPIKQKKKKKKGRSWKKQCAPCCCCFFFCVVSVKEACHIGAFSFSAGLLSKASTHFVSHNASERPVWLRRVPFAIEKYARANPWTAGRILRGKGGGGGWHWKIIIAHFGFRLVLQLRRLRASLFCYCSQSAILVIRKEASTKRFWGIAFLL